MNGYGSHTYMWVNEAGERFWVKYHFHTQQGMEYLSNEEAATIAGQDADYQIKVVVKDMDAFQELLLNRITRIQGVTGVQSSFVLRKVVDTTVLPV